MKRALSLVIVLIMLCTLTLMPISTAEEEPISTGEEELMKPIMMWGRITSYADAPAYGWLRSYAFMHARVGEKAWAYASYRSNDWVWRGRWMEWGWWRCEKNFTYSSYVTRLVNTTMVELNFAGKDFYISGLWDVYKLTTTWVCHNVTREFKSYTYTYPRWKVTWATETVVDDGAGELCVTGNWTDFTIAITGIELIEGEVRYHQFEIPWWRNY